MIKEEQYIKLSSLLPIHLEKAYNILYAGILTDEEITRRPFNIKVERVKQVLAGDVTPGSSARRWYEFFQYLNDAARMQHAGERKKLYITEIKNLMGLRIPVTIVAGPFDNRHDAEKAQAYWAMRGKTNLKIIKG